MRLAADANVLLSAVLGGKAGLVLKHPGVEAYTVESIFAEIHEYAVRLAQDKGLSPDMVLLAVATLPVTIVPQDVFVSMISRARKRIGTRDPDDVDLLALALHQDLTIWSNDNDFADAGVRWCTTAVLLKKLGITVKRS